MIGKIFKFISKHKVIFGLILIALVVGGYFGYKAMNATKTETRYVLAKVEKGTIITSVSGTGQISVTDQVNITPKASGTLTAVYIKAGQEVKSGALIAQINASDAYKAVRDAKANLDSAKLSLEKLQKPVDPLTILQAQNSLLSAQEAKAKAEDDLAKAYDDGFNTVANAFLDLPSTITGLDQILYGTDLGGGGQWNIDYYSNAVPFNAAKIFEFKELTADGYKLARADFDKNLLDYKTANITSDRAVIEALILETYQTIKDFAEVIKNTNNYIEFYKDALNKVNQQTSPKADTQLATLNNYTGTINGHMSNLLAIKTTIQNDKTTITTSDRTIEEKTATLANVKAGTVDALDIKAQELAITQRQNALLDAQQTLANYTMRAPFDGVIASVSSKKGDTVSSGTAVAVLITKQKIAKISLNEVDVAKIKVGQKVTLTFDAISDLTITGEVAEIDAIGTVSQGVVTYGVTIGFDTQDERVKPGMSVSASIITDIKQDILVVPTAAIKFSGTTSYVLMPNETLDATTSVSSTGTLLATAPKQQTVETGISDDTSTEIISGLQAGDLIVTKTITSAVTSASSSTSKSILQNLGGSTRAGGTGIPVGGPRD
ncbi:MAG: efflux RND transporter periplasmic adaptor subunit [Candidatus Parcubacteria bacterium]|nr:efflux RND transporter periplasmic adaptor subunit [Candidatus Parcubacteria bacterium]